MMQNAEVPAIARDSPPDTAGRAALQHRLCRVAGRLSSGLDALERFLCRAGFDRAPWLAVAFAAGIAGWFVFLQAWQWVALISSLSIAAAFGLVFMHEAGRFPYLRQAFSSLLLVAAAGCSLVWAKSELVGAPPIARPVVVQLSGKVLERTEQPAQGRVRLVIAAWEESTGRVMRVRVNVPIDKDQEAAGEGAMVRLRARLVPPAAPMLPGGYDFARTAWFQGLSATGSALSPIEVTAPAQGAGSPVAKLQRQISDHVRASVPGSAGGIAAAFASGDRGGIDMADEEAMRDSGLTHLLSISGLHVSAVIAATWFLAMRLFGL